MILRENCVGVIPFFQASEEAHQCQEDSEGNGKGSVDQEGHPVYGTTSYCILVPVYITIYIV